MADLDENNATHEDGLEGYSKTTTLSSNVAESNSNNEPAKHLDNGGNSKNEPPKKREKVHRKKKRANSSHSSPRRKRSKKRRRRESTSSSSSDDESSDQESTGESSSHDSPGRFEILSKEEQYRWELPSGMADYANKYFTEHIVESDIKENILDENPVPTNLRTAGSLDDFMKAAIGRNSNSVTSDALQEKLQTKVINVMGPLSKVWYLLEETARADGTVNVPVEDLLHHTQQSILLIGQASNAITYQRRLNLVSALVKDTRTAKVILKENQSCLDTNNADERVLFGKKFESQVVEAERSKKRTLEAFGKNREKKPFRKGPPFEATRVNNKYSGGGRFVYNKSSRGSGYSGFKRRSDYNNKTWFDGNQGSSKRNSYSSQSSGRSAR